MNADAVAISPRIECDERAGVLRVHDPRLFRVEQRALCWRLAIAARKRPGVRRAWVDLSSAYAEVVFDPATSDTQFMADAFVSALREATATLPLAAQRGKRPAVVKNDAPPKGVAAGWKRWHYLALAGGSFALTVVGLVVPGVPTVPFLLTTSYYLARSSPRLDARLRRTALLGPVLQEWETEGGLSWRSKGKLAVLTGTVVVVTLLIAPLSSVAVVLIVSISFVSLAGILRLPGLPTDAALAFSHNGRAPLALPAP